MNGKTSTPMANGKEHDLYVGGVETTAAEQAVENARARRLAERYRLPFLDLAQFSCFARSLPI